MADNTYKIEFDISNLDSESAVAKSTTKTTVDEDGGIGNIADAAKAVKKATFGIVSYSTAMSFADQIVSYNISRVSLDTGAVEDEQRQSEIYGVVKDIGGAGLAVLGGALAGGPLGAIAALALSGAHKAISIAQKQSTLDAERDLENITIEMSRRRAGVNGSRGVNQ